MKLNSLLELIGFLESVVDYGKSEGHQNPTIEALIKELRSEL